jgi:hypothetical protein
MTIDIDGRQAWATLELSNDRGFTTTPPVQLHA